jgi:hypothetical protein
MPMHDKTSRSIGDMIPEKWRDLVAILMILFSLLIFFRGVLDKTHTFMAGDNLASDSFKPWVAAADAQGYATPQWIPNIFCGMPAFAALVTTGERAYDLMHELFDFVQSVPRAMSPNADAMTHIWHYFILGLGMYLFLRVTRNTSRLVALFGAFTAMFSTWIITYVMIGHNTKIFAIMTMPYIFMSIERLRRPKMHWQSMVFWSAMLATSLHFLLESTHWQMVFYMLFAVLIYFIVSIVFDLMKKHSLIPLIRSGLLSLAMVALAFGMSADRYLATNAYKPYSIRGQAPIVSETGEKTAPTGGLDWQYATSWSFSPQEMITFLIPGYYGFGKLPYSGPEVQQETRISGYFGQMNGTDAANYMGIVVFFLAIIGILTLWKRDRLVPALSIVSLFALLLSFGGNWPILYRPMFEHFPMFNQFRAPMMALVLMQLCFPIIAALTLEEILRVWKIRDQSEDKRLLRFVTWGLVGAGLLLAYAILGRGAIIDHVKAGASARFGQSYPPSIIDFIAGIAVSDAIMSGLFAVLAIGLAYYFIKRKISPLVFGVGLFLIAAIDLWRVDYRPLDIVGTEDYSRQLDEHDYVQFIKKDHSQFRINDLNDPVSNLPVAWGLETIGGYHAAKMREFQDIVDVTGHMQGNGILNPFMFNLLNCKYIIANGALSEDQSRFQPVFQSSEPAQKGDQRALVWFNPQYLPRAFFVNRWEVKPKLDILKAMDAGSFNPRDVLYFDEAPKGMPALYNLPVDTANETVTISEKMEEVTMRTRSYGPRLLFMSETYYPGWTAQVDGQSTPIYRANYAFRTIVVPKGEHTVKFTFEDPNYIEGRSISLASNGLALLGLAVGISSVYFVRRKKRPEVEVIPPEQNG